MVDRAATRPSIEVHPWVRDAPDMTAANIRRIADVLGCQNACFYDGTRQYVDIVRPLISQPVVECCLRVPSHILKRGSKRNLVSAAFSNDLPPEIVGCADRSGPLEYWQSVVLNSVDTIREVLVDGLLVREGLLDRAKLQLALNGRSTVDGYAATTIVSSLIAEKWARATVHSFA